MPNINGTVELAGSLLAILSGSVFLTMFFSLGRVSFLFFSIAFFINGSEEFFHSIIFFLFRNNGFSEFAGTLLPGTYATGNILMATVLLLTPILEQYILNSHKKKRDIILLSAALLAIAIVANLALFLIQPTIFTLTDSFIARPFDLFSSLIYFAVFIHYFRKIKENDSIIVWFLLSISVLFISQMVMGFSSQINDKAFSIAHFYHVLAYIFPLIGFAQFQVSLLLNEREAEKRLKESEERYMMALYGGELGTWDWNIDTGDVQFNKRWAEMIGYNLNEIEPNVSSWEKLVHPDDMPEVMEVLNKHLEQEYEYYETTHRVKHKNGNWIWVLDKGKVIKRDEEGNALRATGTHLDVTKQKLAEDALKKERDLFTTGPVVLFIWKNEENWPVEFVSSNVEQVLGYKPSDLMSSKIIYESIVHPDDHNRVEEEVVKNTNDRVNRFEHEAYRLVTKNKEIIWVSDYTNIIYDSDGNVTHYMGYVLDITQKKKSEQLEREAEKLRIANQMAATIAHEFNNPLAIIKGNIEMAEMVEIPPEAMKKNNKTVLKQVERMKELVQRLLNIDELNEIHYAAGTKILDLNPESKKE